MTDDDDRIDRGPFRGWDDGAVAMLAVFVVLGLALGAALTRC